MEKGFIEFPESRSRESETNLVFESMMNDQD